MVSTSTKQDELAEKNNFHQILLVNTVLCCLPPLITNILAMYVVSMNRQVNSTIQSYLFCQHAIRSFTQYMRIAFDSTCSIVQWCMASNLAFHVNISVGTLTSSLQVTLAALEVIVTFNRLFTILFDGRFYRRISRLPKLQCVALFAVPIILNVPWQIAGLGSVFYPQLDLWVIVGNDAYYVFIDIVGRAMSWSWYVVVIFDIATMFLFRKRFGARERAVKQEVRLARQILVQHLIGVSLQLAYLSPGWLNSLGDKPNRIPELVINLYSQFINTVLGLNTIYFLREKRGTKTTTITVTRTNNPQMCNK